MNIVLENIFCGYEQGFVLNGFSAIFKSGSRTVIMGPSGKGKTTLLRVLAGLHAPKSGAVHGLPKQVAFLFQEDRLLPWYTVAQNLHIAVPQATPDAAAALLRSLGLEECSGQYPDELSGGMARRAALARALLLPAELLLLDEPFSGLDAETKKTAAAVVRQAAVGKTLIAVAHDPQEAALLQAEILEL